MVYQDIFIDKDKKEVFVRGVFCGCENIANFREGSLSLRHATDILYNKSEFGNKTQIIALKAYEAIAIWRENFSLKSY